MDIVSGGIVDARSRPPISGFLADRTYENLERTLNNIVSRGWIPTESILEKDLGLYMDEVREAGISSIGVPARAPNRWWGGQGNTPIFQACLESEGTFFAYAAVNPFDEGAAESIEALKAEGAKGIIIEPGIADEPAYVNDPGIDPVYEACLGAGIPALVMGGGETGPDLSFSDPSLLEDVAIRFPELDIVNVHGGWPNVQAALGVAFRRPNIWMLPDVYFPGLTGESDYVAAMRTFLQDRFLFATGYPFCPIEATVNRFLEFDLPEEILQKVLRTNAVRLFGLEDD